MSNSGYEVKVYGYSDTLFATKPDWATAAVIFTDTSETEFPDWHDVDGAIYSGTIASDPFHTPYYFPSEESAKAAVESIAGLDLIPAVQKIVAARMTAAKKSGKGA